MSHFSAIGFVVDDIKDYERLIERVLPLANLHSTHEQMSYLRYADPSGAEIWLYRDNEHEQIVCATPCFTSQMTQKLGINAVSPIENGEYGDGTAYGWLNAEAYNKNDGWTNGYYPLVIDLPDYLNHTPSSKISIAHLILFAEQVNLYADKDEFASAEETSAFSSEFFSPSGTFVDEVSDESTAIVLASLTVLQAELRRNYFTNIEFYWCRVATYGGEYEAVYPFDMFDELPKVGNVIFGNYWLTGRFVE